jgi:hypothetical protein
MEAICFFFLDILDQDKHQCQPKLKNDFDKKYGVAISAKVALPHLGWLSVG